MSINIYTLYDIYKIILLKKIKEEKEMMKNLKKNEKGFTLVELVVVIAILALLAALLVPRIMGNVEDAKKSKQIANARTIASEISTYNALVKVNSNGIGAIPQGNYHAGTSSAPLTNLASINRTDAKEFPDESVAEVVVDAQGNASVTIKP